MNQRALALAVALLLLVLGALVFLLRGSDVDLRATAPAGTAGTGATEAQHGQLADAPAAITAAAPSARQQLANGFDDTGVRG
ncbi:MAG TPA: hypothetical protein VK348_03785, partial [Planctomycetota bacterium]|nr:hypothetical protein [Planctomycetota bacterium]